MQLTGFSRLYKNGNNNNLTMENIITFNGKEKKWNYKIAPCLECPIYPMRKEWEDDPDVRNDKCYTSRCTYNRKLSKDIAAELYFMRNNYYCEECNEWVPKENRYCPTCGTDLAL